MQQLLLILFFWLPVSLYSQELNIISFNIRLNTSHDGINAWPHRSEMASGLLRFHDADIFGLQEALYEQIVDLENDLKDFEWIGVGRDDGQKGGEFCPVFYKPGKFILLEHGNFWLSGTPEKPGLGWDAACNRLVTWGRFQSKVTGKQFLVLNTHFDHRGMEARKNSAFLIREKIEEMTYNKNLPVILTGDFNLTPDEEPVSVIKKVLRDSRDISVEPPYGPEGTYNGFKIDADLDRRIDYIFVSGQIKILKYAALTDMKNKRFPSDHLPVFVKLRIN
jgi:endonuclease/exonuclease/phosphatase family metal-dependent hydrolase